MGASQSNLSDFAKFGIDQVVAVTQAGVNLPPTVTTRLSYADPRPDPRLNTAMAAGTGA
ncbi:hypothetical protein KDL01_04665 [Actinospica durhamensis]|uniref:Uncharacterized protein n=1 Tax=Actinospica durhamensis TaxID=1508375 RepID=A0A941EL49_9ACTN|nr:hypothetical protein [Actinospica durhamensis]MBR7832537.1 hypothetical protein [Actinospica durhamensis]